MSRIVTQPPKGTRDFLPEELFRRRSVIDTVREVYESHGFLPLETPTFERLETLLGKYGEEGDQLVFKILRRGEPLVRGLREAHRGIQDEANIVRGRSGETAPSAELMLADMGLRYDLTVPLARVIAEHQGKIPAVFKRYQIQPVWRADTPGKGRFREFFQCDVDVVGSDSLTVEADVTAAVSQCLFRLGFEDFRIRLNHRGLIRAFVEVSGIAVARESEAIIAVDKLDKIGEEGVRKELLEKGFDRASVDQLLSLVQGDADLEQFKSVLQSNDNARAALHDLEKVLSFASVTPASKHLVFDPTLARGLSYYTGCIFEIAVKDLPGSLGGGGRYDGLIGMFQKQDVPACGFSIGLERIIYVMHERGMFGMLDGGKDLLVSALDEDAVLKSVEIACALRDKGLRVEHNPKIEKPAKLKKRAFNQGLAQILFVGSGAGLRLWTREGEEKEVSLDSLPHALGRD